MDQHRKAPTICAVCGVQFMKRISHIGRTKDYCSMRCVARRKGSAEERFWTHVEKTAGCWLWRGKIAPNGYGESNIDQKKISAHRASWIFAHGAIPKGMSVLHRCDVRACVRPDHLFIGTQADNMRDMTQKGRKAGARLTPRDVEKIRERVSAGERSGVVAAAYGVSQPEVCNIVARRKWRFVP